MDPKILAEDMAQARMLLTLASTQFGEMSLHALVGIDSDLEGIYFLRDFRFLDVIKDDPYDYVRLTERGWAYARACLAMYRGSL